MLRSPGGEAPYTGDVQVVPVKYEARFQDLREVWNALAEATDPESIFLRHEWFDAAWQWLRDECELRVLLVTKNEHIVAIWPLVRRVEIHRRIKVHVMEFLSVPDTQLCDVLAAPEHHQRAVMALSTYLDANRRQWDVCRLEKLPASSQTVERLRTRQATRTVRFAIEPAGANAAVRLHEEWSPYYSLRSRGLRRGNRHIENRLNRKSDAVRLRWIRSHEGDVVGANAALEDAIDVSRRSWKSASWHTLANPGPGAFIRKLTSHALRYGWLSLWILELDGEAVAMEYQVVYRGHVHALRADFDCAHSGLSPGTYLNWKILERLFAANLDDYQRGPGDNAYKMRWADRCLPLVRATAHSTTPRARLVALIDNMVRPVARDGVARLNALVRRVRSSRGITRGTRERIGART